MKNYIFLIVLLFISCNNKSDILDNKEEINLSSIGIETFNSIKPYAFFYFIDFESNIAVRYTINIENIHLMPPDGYKGNFDKRLYTKDSISGEFSLKLIPVNERKTKIIKLSSREKEQIIKIISAFKNVDYENSFLHDREFTTPFILRYHFIYKNKEIKDIERVFNLTDNHLELNEEIANLFELTSNTKDK